MMNKLKLLIIPVLVMIISCSFIPAFAAENNVVLTDDADLFTDEEETELKEELADVAELTERAMIYTTNVNDYWDDESLGKAVFDKAFNADKGTDGFVFIIDMDKRELYIYAAGEIYDTITTAKAYEITDRAYSYASDGDYYKCASKAITEINRIMGGDHVFSAMRIVTAVLFGLMFSLFIVTVIAVFSRSPKTKVTDLTTTKSTIVGFRYGLQLTKSERHRHESSSSGGGGGFGGGGGGGGGGSSGGGGGHSF